MDPTAAVVAGLIGTAVMTVVMVMAPKMGMPKMDVMGVLGSMFSADAGTARWMGFVAHFVMGIVFALIYAALWNANVGEATWSWGLIFGLVHGIVAIVAMPMMLGMHPRPSEMERSTKMMAGQIVGHLVFGLVVALTYAQYMTGA